MLGALCRRQAPFAALGSAALQRPIELISTLLAQTRDFTTPSTTALNISDAELQNAAISAVYENVRVGSKLELKLHSQPVQVVTEIGTSHEVVKLYAWTENQPDKGNQPHLLNYGIRSNSESDASTIWASFLEAEDNKTATATGTSPPSPISLQNKISKILAVVPSRYFSFDIETGGGPVEIAASKEASLVSVKTNGGAVTGGTLQASTIFLDSNGGPLSLKQLTASKIDVHSNGGDISVNTLAGLQINIDGGSSAAAVSVGACFVEQQSEFVCGKFTAESLRGGTDGSGSIHVKLISPNSSSCKASSSGGGASKTTSAFTSSATVGGVDGALSISSNQGPATIDLQINEGCRDVMIDTSPRGNTTTKTTDASTVVNLNVAPTLAAHVVLSDCGKDWMLPADTHVVLGGDSTRNVYAQLNVENDEQLGPVSRLQRGNNESDLAGTVGGMPATLAVKGADKVRVQRRSWMQARQEAFRLKRM